MNFQLPEFRDSTPRGKKFGDIHLDVQTSHPYKVVCLIDKDLPIEVHTL